MTATLWPNRLGYDVGLAEVWIFQDFFGVHTPTRCLRVPYSVTRDPVRAAELCERHGLLIADLEEMEPQTAETAYRVSGAKLEFVDVNTRAESAL